jgi:hypothetical protein
MGCGCNKGKTAKKLSWTVDLTGTGQKFDDGSVKKNFTLASEAASAIAKLGLTGKVRPKPTSV